MARPDVRAAAVPASLADVPRLLRAAHAVDQLATGRDVDAAALARAWDVPPPHAARALRRARQALRLHGRRVAAPSPAVPAAPPRAEFLANQVAGWTQRVVLRHLDSLVKEIRETGELAALLAKAASGNTLSEQEWQKVREQLLDVCRAVPSLAVFALPGGALLLPVLLRVLPFDLRPSSFRGDPGAAPPSPGTPAIENLP
ncbi:MAG: hypothetical protein HY904_25455 [Deltaproteobacteria bacterium]|nr:hypothetical protein [Deltaproteobacteria bacterium]